MDKKYPQRTSQQNRALHLYFRQLADELNDRGLSVQETLKPDVSIDWNERLVKELLFRPVQQALLGKKSTTELTTKEIDEVFDIINRHLGEKFGISIEFPSIETIMWRQYETDKK